MEVLAMASTKAKQWTVDAYRHMVEIGILTQGNRVGLLEGQIIEMNSQLPPHAP